MIVVMDVTYIITSTSALFIVIQIPDNDFIKTNKTNSYFRKKK
jgi:hypothetical protein